MGELFDRTGLFVPEKEASVLRGHYKNSRGLITVTLLRIINVPISDAARYTQAAEDFHKGVDAAAVRLGLPELEKKENGSARHYAMDFKNGEILRFN